jgi:hypothetical protein
MGYSSKWPITSSTDCPSGRVLLYEKVLRKRKVTAALLLRCNAPLQTVVDVVDMKIMTSPLHQSTQTSATKGVQQT